MGRLERMKEEPIFNIELKGKLNFHLERIFKSLLNIEYICKAYGYSTPEYKEALHKMVEAHKHLHESLFGDGEDEDE